MKLLLRSSLAMFVLATGLVFVAPAQPALAVCTPYSELTNDRNFFSLPTWDQYLNQDPDKDYAVCNFDFPADIWLIVLALLDILFKVAFYVAGGFIIYGAYGMMSSQGQPDKIAQARSTIANAVIGLVLTILATTIISYVGGQIT
ncbi:MAG: pilin [Candidatus Saccharimonadales bacterium]|nr:pilin [Candidatus Saccharimonadales bacterium]